MTSDDTAEKLKQINGLIGARVVSLKHSAGSFVQIRLLRDRSIEPVELMLWVYMCAWGITHWNENQEVTDLADDDSEDLRREIPEIEKILSEQTFTGITQVEERYFELSFTGGYGWELWAYDDAEEDDKLLIVYIGDKFVFKL